MNACVESVYPNPIRPGRLEAPVSQGSQSLPESTTTHKWFKGVWPAWAGIRQVKIPPIVHVHVESFYTAVEQAENPRLRGKAVLVVGGGAVASASLEAQSRGAVAGMSVRDALKACPNAIVIPGDCARYAECAARVRRILETHAPTVEMAAFGGFYLDFTGTTLPFSSFEAKLRRMQAEILGQTGLSASVGAGTSRMVAALAAREHRPCGLRLVAPGKEREFLESLPIEKLRGIGQRHLSALTQGGVQTIGELQQIPKPVLVAAFGAAVGVRMWSVARGQEMNEVVRYVPVAGITSSRAA